MKPQHRHLGRTQIPLNYMDNITYPSASLTFNCNELFYTYFISIISHVYSNDWKLGLFRRKNKYIWIKYVCYFDFMVRFLHTVWLIREMNNDQCNQQTIIDEVVKLSPQWADLEAQNHQWIHFKTNILFNFLNGLLICDYLVWNV